MTGRPVLSRRGPRQPQRRGLEALIGRDVELRTVGGGVYRGTIEGLDGQFVYLAKHDGRGMLISRAAVQAVLDETRSALAPEQEKADA